MLRPCALVPVKDPAEGKSRLSALLGREERHALNLYLARRTMGVCSEYFGARRTLVVTASAEVAAMARDIGATVVPETSACAGLNPALAAAAGVAIASGADAIVVVPTDLALISNDAIWEAMDDMPAAPGCLLVPDRHGVGTNLMALSPARSDLFAFGKASLRRHAALAAGLGYTVRVHGSAPLALDLDLPEDYRAWLKRSPGVAAATQPAFPI